MFGSAMSSHDYEISRNGERTLLLVGRTGDGKSATGNCILGKKAFRSIHCSSGVTTACELRTTQLEDGKILNVIDTPGLFDVSREPDFVMKELVKCFALAKDAIHAVLLVLSVQTRFSSEEHASIQCVLNLFETKISNYMIVVFTGGDLLEENDEILDDYFGCLPEPLKGSLKKCGNRPVLFDNETHDPLKKCPVEKSAFTSEFGYGKNGGKPYTTYLFKELKVESKMRHLEAELSKERVARLEAEKNAEAALMNYENMRSNGG